MTRPIGGGVGGGGKGKTHDVLTGSDDGRHSKFWGGWVSLTRRRG